MYKIINKANGDEIGTSTSARKASEFAAKTMHSGVEAIVLDADGQEIPEVELAKRMQADD